MRKTKDKSGFFYFFLQLFCFVECEGDRFFNHHMKSIVERHHRRSKVCEVWCNDRNKIHSFIVTQFFFFRDHLFKIEICSVFRKKK